MTDAHTPADGPEEPAQPPEGPVPPSMPPDPFAPADTGYAVIVNMMTGLQRAGATPVMAALFTAAHLAISNLFAEAKKPPEHP